MTENACDRSHRPQCGVCQHSWQRIPHLRHGWELCMLCFLVRYRIVPVGEWEFRVPMPVGIPLGGFRVGSTRPGEN